jgi:hypothetical protein
MRRDEVLKELLNRLTAMGIEPLGALERMPSLVEYRPWRHLGLDDRSNDATAPALKAAISTTQAV